jgi:hypothetical protein
MNKLGFARPNARVPVNLFLDRSATLAQRRKLGLLSRRGLDAALSENALDVSH